MPPHMAVNATIISTGEEILYGRTLDTNAAHMARELGLRGFRLRREVSIGDDPRAVERELLHAAQDSDLIVMSGGLGPTADDRTRDAIARAAGGDLVEDPDTRRYVVERLRRYGRQANEAQLSQARFPEGSRIFPNPMGTARGFACRVGQAWLVALPGVPDEMQAVFRGHVVPFVLEELIPGGHVSVRTLNLFPIAEPDADERISDLTAPDRNPYVGITVSDGVITVSVSAHAETRQEAERLAERDERVLRERFGELVFGAGQDTLAHALRRELERREAKVAVAESLTGGLLGRMLVDVPGISDCFVGGIVAYANDAKVNQLGVPRTELMEHGAVSHQVAARMASGACRAFGAEVGISTTGIAGPTGGTPQKPVGLVYVGACYVGKTVVRELNLHGDRWRNMDRCAKHALNLARLALRRGVQALRDEN